MNLRKSLLRGIRANPLLKFEQDGDSALRGQFQTFFHVRCVGFGDALEDANHFLHFLYFSVGARGDRVTLVADGTVEAAKTWTPER